MALPRCAGWSVRPAARVWNRVRRSSGRRAGQPRLFSLRILPGRSPSEVLDGWDRASYAEATGSMPFFSLEDSFFRAMAALATSCHSRRSSLFSCVFCHFPSRTAPRAIVGVLLAVVSTGGSPIPNESALCKVAPAVSSRGSNVSRGAWFRLETLPRRDSSDAASMWRRGSHLSDSDVGSRVPTLKAGTRPSRTSRWLSNLAMTERSPGSVYFMCLTPNVY